MQDKFEDLFEKVGDENKVENGEGGEKKNKVEN
jgi:hypothetical protein